MDELKLLTEMVSNLPSMALWVIAFFFAYKVTIVGSIYGVIRFVAQKIHDMVINRKTEVNVLHRVHELTITGCMDELISQLRRLRGKGLSCSSEYIHTASVDWLRAAIDDKIAKDEAKPK